jgi:hypothetical protein
LEKSGSANSDFFSGLRKVVDQKKKSEFAEPLFYTFIEKWLQIKWSTANPAHLPQKWDKWAELAVQFSWYLQNGTQDLNFFNYHGCQTFILDEIHCYLSPHIFWTY